MTTRRSVLSATAALVAAPAAAKAKAAARFDVVIFDSRHAESRRFAQVMTKTGATAYDVADDIGQIWFGPLSGVDGKTRVCGLTAHSDFFVSTSLGQEKGLKLRYEGRHDARDPGPVAHDLSCATAATTISHSGRDWAGALANTLLRDDPARPRKAKATTRSARPPKAAATLFSWILA
jgi:hypothetical protein